MDKSGWHHALYHRLRWLWPLLLGRLARSVWRGLGWLALVMLVAFAGLLSYLRYDLMPRAGEYQGEIEAAVSRALGLDVRFGQMNVYWAGVSPALLVHDLSLTDRKGQAALVLSEVRTELSWRSLWHREPTLGLLSIESPVLTVRRDSEGKITVAGLSVEGESDPRMADWILRQTHIRIRNASIEWRDDKRQAPPLRLEQLQLGLDNRGDSHRFGVTATPPSEMASRLDLRGDFDGESLLDLAAWSGKFFAQMDYVDLAAWAPWLDYPVALPRGKGGLRLWLDVAPDEHKLVVDTALDDVRLRLGKKLPELDLIRMRGRFEAAHESGEWKVAGRQLALATRDGVDMPPATFAVDWRQDKEGRLRGSANATRVDLLALNRLSSHLPLDERTRGLLNDYQPRGVLSDLRGHWESQGETVVRYGLKGRFESMGILPVGQFPGALGLSGEIDATEKGGSLRLDSHKASLDLPRIFAEPRLAFDELQAKARWKLDKGQLDARLESLQFANADVAGSAQGSYLFNGDGPGKVDMTAKVTRGQASAVWRYLPLAVNAEARNWVRRGLVNGTASDAKMELRGDLRDFPFLKPEQGKFLVALKAKDVKIDYAPGWPALEQVSGDVRFEGPGMVVEARQGKLLGANLGPVRAEIPDFDSKDQLLMVKGKAQGATQAFLDYIEKSPVSEMIDRFTEGMKAAGHGNLDLELSLPLHRVVDTRIKGLFQFQAGSSVTVMEGLPPVTEVAGQLSFTESAIQAKEVKGRIFGSPMKLSAMSEGDKVSVNLSGGFQVAEARKSLNWPFLAALSGTTSWKGEVRVRKKSTELVIDSNLAGISSALPEPFNKLSATPMPLRLVRGNLPVTGGIQRDQLSLTLGKWLDARLIWQRQGQESRLERGAVGIGEVVRLPSRGLALGVTLPTVEVDAWQRWVLGENSGSGSGLGGTPTLPSGSVLSVRTPLLLAQGRRFEDLALQLRPDATGWQIGLNARQAAGDLYWNGTGRGALRADLRRLYLNTEGDAGDSPEHLIDDLPGLDVRVADFAINQRRFGRLEVRALNEAGAWRIDKLNIDNPDGHMAAKGLWKNRGGFNRTQLEFDLDSANVGGLLDRLGFAGSIKRGSAKLKGQVSWQGSPTRLDHGSLGGEMSVEASKGQFAKVEPGLGKLLGLISLQSLPRRISLDFRDVFSDGFAFDSIESRLVIREGIMRTAEDLRIDGPSARVLIKGEADLKAETQNLLVSIQPELGGAAAMGVALANPVVGVATLLASKVLQNPLNKLFAFQYKVTGSWDDPKVEKVSQTSAPADSKGESK